MDALRKRIDTLCEPSRLRALVAKKCQTTEYRNFVRSVLLHMNSTLPLERLLQKMRFGKVVQYLEGEVLDFGGKQSLLHDYLLKFNLNGNK